MNPSELDWDVVDSIRDLAGKLDVDQISADQFCDACDNYVTQGFAMEVAYFLQMQDVYPVEEPECIQPHQLDKWRLGRMMAAVHHTFTIMVEGFDRDLDVNINPYHPNSDHYRWFFVEWRLCILAMMAIWVEQGRSESDKDELVRMIRHYENTSPAQRDNFVESMLLIIDR